MRKPEDMKRDKFIAGEIPLLRPRRLPIHNYAHNGVEVFLETDLNKEMKRGFVGKLTLRDGSKEMYCYLDRDELIMTAQPKDD